MEPEDPRLAAAARHALHDEELVAAYAVDGDGSEEAAKARLLIERCTTCHDLHADLVAVGAAVRAAGTAEAVGAVRAAPRDFRLTASDAARLQGGNALQRAAARLIDGIAGYGRPVGASLATLGLVGLLVGTMSVASLGGPASMTSEGNGAAAPAATHDGAGLHPLATSATDRSNQGPEATDATENLTANGTGDVRQSSNGTSWLFAGSIGLLVLGAALFLSGARRRRPALTRSASRR